jgi:hypothetical protein
MASRSDGECLELLERALQDLGEQREVSVLAKVLGLCLSLLPAEPLLFGGALGGDGIAIRETPSWAFS